MNYHIRPYTSQDKEPVIELLRQNIPEYFAPEEESDLVEYLDKLREDYYVIEQEGSLVAAGGLNYFPEELTARISWDFVGSEMQGKGLGSELLRFRVNHIQEQGGYDKIVVRTTQLAYVFYQKNGFKLLKKEKDYWAKGFDLYLMELSL